MLNSYFFYNEGEESLGLYIAFTFEELLEMLGIAMFIYAILDYMKSYLGEVFYFGLKNQKTEEVKTGSAAGLTGKKE